MTLPLFILWFLIALFPLLLILAGLTTLFWPMSRSRPCTLSLLRLSLPLAGSLLTRHLSHPALHPSALHGLRPDHTTLLHVLLGLSPAGSLFYSAVICASVPTCTFGSGPAGALGYNARGLSGQPSSAGVSHTFLAPQAADGYPLGTLSLDPSHLGAWATVTQPTAGAPESRSVTSGDGSALAPDATGGGAPCNNPGSPAPLDHLVPVASHSRMQQVLRRRQCLVHRW